MRYLALSGILPLLLCGCLAQDLPRPAAAGTAGWTAVPIAMTAALARDLPSAAAVPGQEPKPVPDAALPPRPPPDQPDPAAATGQAATPAAGEKAAADLPAGTLFLPEQVTVWQAMANPADLAVAVEKESKINLDGMKQYAYAHPFHRADGFLGSLFVRFVTEDYGASNFDMRDTILLPLPSRLTASVPVYRNAALSFSVCLAGQAFEEKSAARQVSFRISYAGTNGSQVLLERPLDMKKEADSKDWVDVLLPLPEDAGERGAVTIETSGDRAGMFRQGLAVANLSVLVKLDGPDDPQVERLSGLLGSPGGPNLLVIFIDSARGDSVGPGNKAFPSVTPVLDKLAEGGVAFTRAFTVANQTRPSIVGFLQSMHPTVGGFHSPWWSMRQKVIDAYYETKPPLVPLLLQKVGYTTASIGRNHFQFGTTRLALDPGFETVFDNRRSQTDTVHVIDRSIKWLDANQDRKFFLLVNISPPHQPYNPPDKYKKWTKARLKGSKTLPLPEYLSEIYYADQEIGRLLQHLDELRLTGRTAILVTADHGETMHNDHSCYSQLFKTICHTSHGLTLYDEELHVPFIWSLPFWPDLRQGERTSIVSHLDAAPTLLALAGAAPNVRYTGRSLLPDMLGEPAADEELYFEMRMASGVRINGWKFILHHKKDDARTGSWTSDPGVTSEELYDLANDPYETKNLASRRKDKAEELRQDLRRIRTRNRDYEAQTRNTVWTPVRPPGGAGTAPPAPETAPAFAPAAAPGQEPTADPTNEPEAEPDRPDSAPAQSPPAQPAAPDAAPPGAAQPHADSRGYLYLALNHGGRERRFTGEVRTEGAFAALEVLGDPACIQEAGPHSIRLDCAVNEGPFRARVQVVPPLSPVVFDVTVDGKPLSARYFYLGRYGLALAAEKRLADPETWALARSVSAPHFLPGFDPGIFVWHDMSLPCGSAGASLAGPPAAAASDEAPAAEDFEGEQIEDETTRNALKAEGYWK